MPKLINGHRVNGEKSALLRLYNFYLINLFMTFFFSFSQIEELYSEILFKIIHNVGCDVESQEEQSQIIKYLQQAFHLEDEKHNVILEAVRAKEAPNILLNVEVIEAKDLRPKDANGMENLKLYS